MKEFGIQIYSVRDHLTTKEELIDAYKKVKEMGYSYIHTASIHNYPAEFLMEVAKETGLTYCGTHYMWDKICNDIEGTIADHKALGTTNIGIGGMPGEARGSLKALREFIAKFNELANVYYERGFKLTYHNHSFEFMKLEDGKTLFDHLVEELDPVKTSFVLDTHWVQHGGADVRATIEKLSGRIDILHIKDMEACHSTVYNTIEVVNGEPVIKKVVVNAPAIIEIGAGNINFKDIIPLAEKCGVKYFVVEDDRAPATGDSFAAVKRSADYIKANLLDL